MRFSKEKIKELKEKVRFEMVRNPNVSILELQDILSQDYGHRFDKDFIGKIKQKIHRERALRYNSVSLKEELAIFEETIMYEKRILGDIIFDEEGKYKPKEIISACREFARCSSLLFEAKMNAGIFNKTDEPQAKEGAGLSPRATEIVGKALSFYSNSGHEEEVNEFLNENRTKN